MQKTPKSTNMLTAILINSYQALLFITPLIVCFFAHELFEFPKMFFVYGATILITSLFLLQTLQSKKLTLPYDKGIKWLLLTLAAFFSLYILATVNSLHPYTSFWGYYSRVNGGLLSLICYLTLATIGYLVLVSKKEGGQQEVYKLIKTLLASSFIVSGYAIGQHFGVDKAMWVQNSQARVFSTLGQPNWLAAYLAAILPLSLLFSLNSEGKEKYQYSILFIINFAAIWFTYSLSGILGMGIGVVSFLCLLSQGFLQGKKKELLTLATICALISLLQPGMFGERIKGTWGDLGEGIKTAGIALAQTSDAEFREKGSTINMRLVVWQGTVKLIKDHLLLGTGPETFAYAFLPYRPLPLNDTTEWDFLYNKAHNEYLNLAAGTGLPALIAYLLIFPFLTLIIFQKNRGKAGNNEKTGLTVALFAGWVTLWITNFFGFSVVATNLLFWLFPTLILVLKEQSSSKEITFVLKGSWEKLLTIGTLGLSVAELVIVGKIFWADVSFTEGLGQEKKGEVVEAALLFNKAIELNPREPTYWRELAYMYIKLAEDEQLGTETDWAVLADAATQKAVALNPRNSLTLKSAVKIYGLLAIAHLEEETYYQKALEVAQANIKLAPTDPKTYYNLGLTYLIREEKDRAKEAFEKALELKSDYLAAQEEVNKL